MSGFSLYGRYVAASIRAQMAYPAGLALMTAGSFLITVVEFIGVWALFGRFSQGLIVFGIGMAMTHIAFGVGSAAILVFAVAGGVALFSGLFVLQATLSFWTVESLEAVNILTYGGEAAAEYPLNVYARWFRDFLLWGVPIGCVTYLPMLAAMGRPDPLGAPAWLTPLAPAAGFAFLGGALFVWRFGVRRYTSTGS